MLSANLYTFREVLMFRCGLFHVKRGVRCIFSGFLFVSSESLRTFAPSKRLIVCHEAARMRACGGIGRHARLRIWCREACRFESYQAYKQHVISP